jgi:serine/threonine protein phosphatase 1
MNLRKFKKNQYGSDYVVGDIHGCYDLLITTLEGLNFDFGYDRLFSVGDLIDRGPDSLKCLELCYEPWFFSVRGNHEEMMFESIIKGSSIDRQMWFQNGGLWYENEKEDGVDATIHDLSERLPLGIEVETERGKIGIVHADVHYPQWEDNFNTKDSGVLSTLLWSRSRVMGRLPAGDVQGINTLYVGHTPIENVDKVDNVMYIDTGAVHTGKLTILKI